MVDLQWLDSETARELRGNMHYIPPDELTQAVLNERQRMWKSYYSRNRKPNMRQLARELADVSCDEVFFLGCGSGRDVEYVLSFMPLHTVYCSDLSLTSLQQVPYRLQPYALQMGLFTSDLSACPVKARTMPVVIVNALHHTQDIHAPVEDLMRQGVHNIFINEPANNWLIRWLARRGIAQRIEYSGVKPGRLELHTVHDLAQRYGYRVKATTFWVFPSDYYRRLFSQAAIAQTIFFGLLNLLSRATNLIKFGNQAVVRLEKIQPTP